MNRRSAILLASCLLLATLPLGGAAHAGTSVTVSSVAELRTAIDDAQTAATAGDRGPHVIELAEGNYQLSGAPSDGNATGSLAITGYMAGGMDIELRGQGVGAQLRGTATAPGDRVLYLAGTDLAVTLRNLSLSGGRSTAGAGIRMVSDTDSRLELVDMTLSDNAASSSEGDYVTGGGMVVEGVAEVVVRRSRLIGNSAVSTGSNQAVGAGADIRAETVEISDTEVRDNETSSATNEAGAPLALMMIGDSSAIVERTTIAGNNSVAPAERAATTAFRILTVTPGNPWQLTMRNTTVVGNTGTGSSVTAVFIAGQDGTSLLEHDTIAGNTGRGLWSLHGTVNVARTVIAGSTVQNCINWAGATTPGFVSAGHNLATDDSCPLGHGTDLDWGPAGLGPLGDHGGLTATAAPQPGSVLLDAAGSSAAATDQRGLPRSSGAAADIGAHEHQGPTATSDAFTVDAGSTAVLPVLANDLAGEDALAPASVTVIAHPSSGTVGAPDASGAIPYSAPADSAVSDHFTYRVCQAVFSTTCSTATVAIDGAGPPPLPPPAPERGVVRVFGPDRIATAVAASQASFEPGVPVAYVATGFAFPDALAGGPAAARDGGPILLTTRDALPGIVAEELARLAPGRIVVLGGTAAVSPAVEKHLGTIAPVERLSGADRFATAARIAGSFAAPSPTVFVSTGLNFPDALSGSAAAARSGAPILLSLPGSLPEPTRAALLRLAPSAIVVLGGAAAVGSEVEAELAAIAPVRRLWGRDRYATSAAIADTFPAPTDVALVATGQNFPDALAGAAVAATTASPVLLVPPAGLTPAGDGALRRLSPLRIVVLGGEGVVPESVQASLAGYLRD